MTNQSTATHAERRGVRSLAIRLSAFVILSSFVIGHSSVVANSAKDSLRHLRPRSGFQVDLVAAEPLIQSPVAFDWGADGKLWVVEMPDYPLGTDNKGKPGGRIKVLEKASRERERPEYDKATIFLDGLLFPTGVMTWGKGVLVTCAPEIFYAEDTDGDGKADRKVVLFTGFGEANPQHRLNGLRWGLDNWIHCANGDFAAVRKFEPDAPARVGGKIPSGYSSSQAEDLRRLMLAGGAIRSTKMGATYSIRNRDFRIRPDEGLLDPQSGQAQFGRDRDDWGNWFGCNNAIPFWHFALHDQYLRRNPYAIYPSPRVEAPPSVTYPLGTVGRDTGSRRTGKGNPWTSACNITVYRDNLFGPDFADSWFVCEPVHNLVHRGRMIATGATFSVQRADDEKTSEFLASTDPMFSPVMVRTGPDGALWIADMYRNVLEHPHWLPAGWEKTIDVRAGHDKGRIYRVYPNDMKPRSWPRLDKLDAPGLVACLENSNGWVRDKAQQLLIEQKNKEAIPLLREWFTRSTAPLGRLHALCTLDGLKRLDSNIVERGLNDRHPALRRHGARLSEALEHRTRNVQSAMMKLSTDPSAGVRQQVAYSLGGWEAPEAARALGELLRRERDPYIVAAAISSLNPKNLAAVLETALVSDGMPSAVTDNLLRTAVGFRDARSIGQLLSRFLPENAKDPAAPFTAVAGFLDALDQCEVTLKHLAGEKDETLQATLRRLANVIEAARRTATDLKAPLAERISAARLLGRDPERRAKDRTILMSLLVPSEAESLQSAAVVALGRLAEPAATKALLDGWKGYTPGVRAVVLDALLQRSDGADTVLAALENKSLLPQEVPLAARRRLSEYPRQEVRARAAKLLAEFVNPDRDRVVVAYQAALRLKGNHSQGKALFAKHCSACHRLGGVGNAVGPDLAMVRDKAPEWFLPALLDPSRAVEARYVNYVAVLKDGRLFTGVLTEERGNQLTLVGPTGQPQSILRSNIEELYSTGKSAMPDGLEKELNHQDVADLIAYLRQVEIGPVPNSGRK